MLKVGQVYPTQLQSPKLRGADQLHLEEELTTRSQAKQMTSSSIG